MTRPQEIRDGYWKYAEDPVAGGCWRFEGGWIVWTLTGATMATETTIRDGYYTVSFALDEPPVWRVNASEVSTVWADGSEKPLGESAASCVRVAIRRGEAVPSRWLPPGVTHNPAADPAPSDDAVSHHAKLAEAVKAYQRAWEAVTNHPLSGEAMPVLGRLVRQADAAREAMFALIKDEA